MSKINIALGYDDERPYGDYAQSDAGRTFLEEKISFLKNLNNLFNANEIKRTHSLLGVYLNTFRELHGDKVINEVYSPKNNPLIEIAQHSYTHPIIRHLPDQPNKEPFSQIEFVEDVEKANELIFDILGVNPTGMRIPCGYPCDLSDKVEIVSGLKKLGFDYISSNLRANYDSLDAPLSIERQPHTYTNIGFDSFVEIPSSGLQDVIFLPEKSKLFPNDIKKNF